jgi:trk system potassium uptake protein TrkH
VQYKNIIRILGILVALLSVTMLPPALVSLIYRDGGGVSFIMAFLLCLATGLIAWYPNRKETKDLRSREGFLIVVLFWVVLGSFSAIPLLLLDHPNLSLADAIFESFSGLTTTGATILTKIEGLPHSVLFYRQQIQWLGGMGIIVLAIAVLPMLGIGGMQLYRAETPGPVKDSKMTPRISDTAKHLWYIYFVLTIACTIAYMIAGMNFFDALTHSFATISNGGFSTYDESIGHFNSQAINYICAFFCLMGAVNFSLHYGAVRYRTLKSYYADAEFKVFFYIQLGLALSCFIVLWHFNTYDSATKSLNQAVLQTVSFSTSAGFSSADFSHWPLFLPLFLIFSSFIGSCAGSTGGGLKVVRALLLYLQGMREINRLIHPKGIFTVKLGDRAVPDRIVQAVWGFFAAYTIVFVICMMLLLASGLDNITAFTAVAACINNLGPGLGEVSSSFATINDFSKWVLVMAMLFGRLEIFTLLVLFTPAFWRT